MTSLGTCWGQVQEATAPPATPLNPPMHNMSSLILLQIIRGINSSGLASSHHLGSTELAKRLILGFINAKHIGGLRKAFPLLATPLGATPTIERHRIFSCTPTTVRTHTAQSVPRRVRTIQSN